MKNISFGLRFAARLILGFAVLAPLFLSADSTSPSLVNFNIENSPYVDNPWGGVNSYTGELKVIIGQELQVSDSGTVVEVNFSPSVAVGDLNGDGLPDLVVADTRGFIWFYPNSGTKTNAVFTHGEVMPIWFGKDGEHNDVAPRIQLTDFNGDGKLDLVVGTFDGSLYMLPNIGAPTQPVFRQPQNLDDIDIATRSQGVLWCNFLAPCLYDWSGKGLLDLIMGEGTYSANSIYLLHNMGSNSRPIFNETHTVKLIPGMGREHLTPRVIDWNGDGKPDVLCGERAGYLDLFLNTTVDPSGPATFSESHLRVGNQEQFGQLTSVNVVDLNDNKLPNLVISSTDGRMLYATNTGTPGKPLFATAPVALKGKNPYPKIYLPTDWILGTPYGNSYELLVATSADVEPGFTPPADHKGKFALRAYVMNFQNTWFKNRFFVDPSKETSSNQHSIIYRYNVPIQAGTRYELNFNVKTDGDIESPYFYMYVQQRVAKGMASVNINKPFGTSGSWSHVSEIISWESQSKQQKDVGSMKMSFRWAGTGSFYIDDVSIRKAE